MLEDFKEKTKISKSDIVRRIFNFFEKNPSELDNLFINELMGREYVQQQIKEILKGEIKNERND